MAAGGGGGMLARLGARLSWWLLKRERCGVDEFGNVFYRKLEKNADGEVVEKRLVSYRGDIDPTSLPAEWHQWLHRARADPPTPEDIARGMHQRELFRQRVAEIEAEEARRRFQEQTGGGRGGGGGEFVQQLPGAEQAAGEAPPR